MSKERGRFVESLKIIAAMTGIAVACGLLHDLFSSAVCTEYFTDHHPKIIESRNWLAMALLWGVIATWWVGFFGGVWLAVCSQVGKSQPLPFEAVMKRAVKATVIVLGLAPITWIAIYMFGSQFVGMEASSNDVTELDVRLMASGIMHAQSYFLAGLFFLFMGLMMVWDRTRAVETEK